MASSAANNPEEVGHDLFLSHDWGVDGTNHERVLRVGRVLSSRLGLKPWIDAHELRANLHKEMAVGIGRSRGVVVFVTKRYHDKVIGGDSHDNCQYEYELALNNKSKAKMVAVVMEREMLDSKKWMDNMMALGGSLYVDLTDLDQLSEEQLERRLRDTLLKIVTPWLGPRSPDPEGPETQPGATAAAAHRTGSSHIIAPDVRVFLKETIRMDDEFVESLAVQMKGLRCIEDLAYVEEADMEAARVPTANIRRFKAKRPESAATRRAPPPAVAPTSINIRSPADGNTQEAQALASLKSGSLTLAQIQSALRKHSGSAAVAEQACWALCNMCVNADNQAEAGRLGLLAEVQSALRKHSGSAAVAESACGALWNMCVNNADNKAEAGRLGLLAEVQSALRQHSGSAAVAKQASGALCNMCAKNADNKAEAGRLGLLAEVQSALRKHSGSAAVAEQACAALWNMCASNADNQAEAGRLGLLAEVQSALRKHSGSAAVAEQACGALCNMCVNADNQAEAGRLGLLAEVQSALRKHSGSAAVAEAACRALCNMCSGLLNRNKAEAGRLGLLAEVQSALQQHSGSAAVAEQACWALCNMCFDNDNKAEAGRLGLVADLRAVLKQHSGNSSVKTMAEGAIRFISAWPPQH